MLFFPKYRKYEMCVLKGKAKYVFQIIAIFITSSSLTVHYNDNYFLFSQSLLLSLLFLLPTHYDQNVFPVIV